jgi:hypothetical protein
MELRPYYDRPTAILADYLARIDTKIKANYPHWGYENKGVWPKGEYGKGVLRADQFSILGTYGQWLIPSSGSSGNPNSTTVDTFGWSQRTLDFKTLEEFYYLLMGIQYPVTPLLITEHQWRISGIETPVIEPEKTVVCAHRVVGGASAFGNGTVSGAEKWRLIGSVVGQHHELIQQRQSIGELS